MCTLLENVRLGREDLPATSALAFLASSSLAKRPNKAEHSSKTLFGLIFVCILLENVRLAVTNALAFWPLYH